MSEITKIQVNDQVLDFTKPALLTTTSARYEVKTYYSGEYSMSIAKQTATSHVFTTTLPEGYRVVGVRAVGAKGATHVLLTGFNISQSIITASGTGTNTVTSTVYVYNMSSSSAETARLEIGFLYMYSSLVDGVQGINLMPNYCKTFNINNSTYVYEGDIYAESCINAISYAASSAYSTINTLKSDSNTWTLSGGGIGTTYLGLLRIGNGGNTLAVSSFNINNPRMSDNDATSCNVYLKVVNAGTSTKSWTPKITVSCISDKYDMARKQTDTSFAFSNFTGGDAYPGFYVPSNYGIEGDYGYAGSITNFLSEDTVSASDFNNYLTQLEDLDIDDYGDYIAEKIPYSYIKEHILKSIKVGNTTYDLPNAWLIHWNEYVWYGNYTSYEDITTLNSAGKACAYNCFYPATIQSSATYLPAGKDASEWRDSYNTYNYCYLNQSPQQLVGGVLQRIGVTTGWAIRWVNILNYTSQDYTFSMSSNNPAGMIIGCNVYDVKDKKSFSNAGGVSAVDFTAEGFWQYTNVTTELT